MDRRNTWSFLSDADRRALPPEIAQGVANIETLEQVTFTQEDDERDSHETRLQNEIWNIRLKAVALLNYYARKHMRACHSWETFLPLHVMRDITHIIEVTDQYMKSGNMVTERIGVNRKFAEEFIDVIKEFYQYYRKGTSSCALQEELSALLNEYRLEVTPVDFLILTHVLSTRSALDAAEYLSGYIDANFEEILWAQLQQEILESLWKRIMNMWEEVASFVINQLLGRTAITTISESDLKSAYCVSEFCSITVNLQNDPLFIRFPAEHRDIITKLSAAVSAKNTEIILKLAYDNVDIGCPVLDIPPEVNVDRKKKRKTKKKPRKNDK